VPAAGFHPDQGEILLAGYENSFQFFSKTDFCRYFFDN
jgi:hypothetical protein